MAFLQAQDRQRAICSPTQPAPSNSSQHGLQLQFFISQHLVCVHSFSFDLLLKTACSLFLTLMILPLYWLQEGNPGCLWGIGDAISLRTWEAAAAGQSLAVLKQMTQ